MAKFFKTFATCNNPQDGSYNATRNIERAKFDMLTAVHIYVSKVWGTGGNNSWQQLHSINPDLLIYVYRNGAVLLSDNDPSALQLGGPGGGYSFVGGSHGVGDADRWTSVGNIFGASDDLVGKVNDGYDHNVYMNLLKPNWITYWCDNALASYEGQTNPYASGTTTVVDADGVFCDNAIAGGFPALYQRTHQQAFSDDNASYADTPSEYSGTWYYNNTDARDATHDYWETAKTALALQGFDFQPNGYIAVNRDGDTAGDFQKAQFAVVEALSNPPLYKMSEGWLSVASGEHAAHQSDGDNAWKNAVDAVAAAVNTKILCRASAGLSGSGTMDDTISGLSSHTGWTLLWYDMQSFLLAYDRGTVNGMFCFSVDSSGHSPFDGGDAFWFDEFDPAYYDMGNPMGAYFTQAATGGTVYLREYDAGWVVVNPTTSTVSNISVPSGQARVINHSNFTNTGSASLITSFSMTQRSGIALLKENHEINEGPAEGGEVSGQIYKRSVTVNHTKVLATLTNFPVLIKLTHADLKSLANGGHVNRVDGYDLIPYSDSALTTMMDFELVSYDPTTGAIVMWVKVPSLSSSSDTVFYLGYGDTSITTYQGDVSTAGTWSG